MTQIASLLAVATVFIDHGLHLQSGRGGALKNMREIELRTYAGTRAKNAGGGGVIAKFYGKSTARMNLSYMQQRR